MGTQALQFGKAFTFVDVKAFPTGEDWFGCVWATGTRQQGYLQIFRFQN